MGWKEKDKIEYGVLSLIKRVMSRTFIRYCNSQQGKTGIQGRAMKYKSGHVRIKQLSGNREKNPERVLFLLPFLIPKNVPKITTGGNENEAEFT